MSDPFDFNNDGEVDAFEMNIALDDFMNIYYSDEDEESDNDDDFNDDFEETNDDF